MKPNKDGMPYSQRHYPVQEALSSVKSLGRIKMMVKGGIQEVDGAVRAFNCEADTWSAGVEMCHKIL